MRCHLCGKEMRIVNVEVLAENDIFHWTEETWYCDHCDGWTGLFRRMIGTLAKWLRVVER